MTDYFNNLVRNGDLDFSIWKVSNSKESLEIFSLVIHNFILPSPSPVESLRGVWIQIFPIFLPYKFRIIMWLINHDSLSSLPVE